MMGTRLIKGKVVLLLILTVAILLGSYLKMRNSAWHRIKDPETVAMLKRFISMKKAQAYGDTNGVPPEIGTMFKYAERGDWRALDHSMSDLQVRIQYWASLGHGIRHWHGVRGAIEDFVSDAVEKVGLHWEPKDPPRLEGTYGEAIKEVHGALEAFVVGDESYSRKFGQEIIHSIPPGSVFLSGDDTGRFVVTAMCQLQPEGDPFFIISPQWLLDMGYCHYLRSMYGNTIYIMTDEDVERYLQDFYAQAEREYLSHKKMFSLRDGDGPAKEFFDKNPDREFFIEPYPGFESLTPYLEPHGLIAKVNRQPSPEISADIVKKDQDYWSDFIRPMIGDWLDDKTAVPQIAEFVERVYLRNEFDRFHGDPVYVKNTYAQGEFVRTRVSIAEMYQLRAANSTDPDIKKRMNAAADFAFRQAWVLGPSLPEAVYPYINFLVSQGRLGESLLIVQASFGLTAAGDRREALRTMEETLKEHIKTNQTNIEPKWILFLEHADSRGRYVEPDYP